MGRSCVNFNQLTTHNERSTLLGTFLVEVLSRMKNITACVIMLQPKPNALVRLGPSCPRVAVTYFQKFAEWYELIKSASWVPHEFCIARQLRTNFKHVWNLPELPTMHHTLGELLLSSSRVRQVTHEFHELPTSYNSGATRAQSDQAISYISLRTLYNTN